MRYNKNKKNLVSVYVQYKFIETKKGNKLLMVNGHTFWRNNRSKLIYYCSKKSHSCCKSSVRLDDEGTIVNLREEHNHAPPVYKELRDGRYVKLW